MSRIGLCCKIIKKEDDDYLIRVSVQIRHWMAAYQFDKNISSYSKMDNNMNTNDVVDVEDYTEAAPEAPTTPTTPTIPDETPESVKSGAEAIPVKLFKFSQHDLTTYLQNNVLGIPILTGFERWDGNPGNCYVRMRVALPAKALVDSVKVGNPMINRMLQEDGSNYLIRKDILDELKPFMYNPCIAKLQQMPDKLNGLAKKGITPDRLAELIEFSTFKMSKKYDGEWYCIYLKPEAIIEDMVSLPSTSQPSGQMSIVSVVGGEKGPDGSQISPISWRVVVDDRRSATEFTTYDVTVDELYKNLVI